MLLRGHAGEHTGYVLDGAVEEDFMAGLDCVRNALPVDKDKKKTDAARRFFCAWGFFFLSGLSDVLSRVNLLH